MEEKTKDEEYCCPINYRAKKCLISYIVHLLKEDTERLIKQNNLKINIKSSSDKSTIGNIYYTMNIVSSQYNEKLDIKENLQKIQKFNSSMITLRDEFNNPINSSEISIKTDLTPYIEKKTIINFDFFNFFFYNGKRFHKFNLKPIYDSDEFYDTKCKLFIYFYYFNNKILCNNLIEDFDKYTKDENFWKIIGHIYIIIPVKDRNIAKENHDIILDNFNLKNNQNPKMSIVYLTEDINDGNAINIFTNYYQKYFKNYFFILNHLNKVKVIQQIQYFEKEFKKFRENYIKSNEPIGEYKIEKKEKKDKIKKLFNFLIDFIEEIPNLNYILDFTFNLKYSIVLDEPTKYFKLKDIELIDIGGSLRTNEYTQFKKYIDGINDERISFKVKELETIDIPINFTKPFNCKICKKIIPNDKECFYCYLCVEYYCYDCVKKNYFGNIGIKKFIDKKHNLLFFKTRDIKNFINIDRHKLGTNSFTKSSNFKTHHSASCDGCRSSFYSSPRYICLTCKPGIYLAGGYSDFCYICIESMMRNDEKAKKIKQKSDPISYNYSTFCRNHQLIDNHDHENHIYLMVALEGILSSYQGF